MAQRVVPVEWFERYARRIEEWRLPEGKQRQDQWMQQIGEDGSRLLTHVWAEQDPEGLRHLVEVEGLRRMWVQQFFWQEGVLLVRNKDDLPPAHLTIRSPYDHEAHYGHKRDMSWYGYKVHFSETCDDSLPHLITHVVTTGATETNVEQTEAIHQALSTRGLAPRVHLLDAGYVDAEIVLQSRDHQWQAKDGQGYDLASFTIDWQEKFATCPQGKQSVKWTERTDQHGHPKIAIRFGLHDCRDCPARCLCTRSATAPRILAMRHQGEFEVLQQARLQQQTREFQQPYAQRSDIEGTHSQGVRSLGLRRTRYFGLPKTSLQHCGTATAMNLIRLDALAPIELAG